MKTEKPDYKGFVEHLNEYIYNGISIGFSDLIKLAKKYNTPIPIRFDSGNIPVFKEEELNSK